MGRTLFGWAMDPTLPGNPNTNNVNSSNTSRGGGPLSRTWPQIFKKRRRASPPRDGGQDQHHLEVNTLPPLKIPLPKSGNVTVSETGM